MWQLCSDLNIPGSAPMGTGRFLGSQTKMMSTAGYATNRIPFQSVLAHKVKTSDQEVVEGQLISMVARMKRPFILLSCKREKRKVSLRILNRSHLFCSGGYREKSAQ